MNRIVSIAPVLPVTNLQRALQHYQALGFATRAYQRSSERAVYGFADRDGVQLHLCEMADLDPRTNPTEVYFYVSDAHELHESWAHLDLPGLFVAPLDTDYGLCEGAHIDPDGNSLRYGSWLREA